MEKVWLASYPDGVPEIIPDPPFSSLTEMMKASMIQFSSRKAYTNMGSSITFGELDKLSDKFACYLLRSLGLKKGDRVIVQINGEYQRVLPANSLPTEIEQPKGITFK